MPESGPFQIELFDGFISRYTKRLDQLRLVEMAVTVAQQYEGAWSGGCVATKTEYTLQTETRHWNSYAASKRP